MLVGRIEQHGVAARQTADDEHVVVDRTDDHLVHLDVSVRPVKSLRRIHALSLAFSSARASAAHDRREPRPQ